MNANIYTGNVQPNHKEFKIWVTPTNEDGSKEVKYWNRKKHEWDGCNGGDSTNQLMVYQFWTDIQDKRYIADYSYFDGEYSWWFWEEEIGNANEWVELTHEEYKRAIVNAAKTIEGTDFRYAYGYVDEITKTSITLGYAFVNDASTSKLTDWSQQTMGTVIVSSNNDFILLHRGDAAIVKNEVHMQLYYRKIEGTAYDKLCAQQFFDLFYPHVKGTECKIYDKNMKLLLTIENSACAYPITDPYLNEQTIVIENLSDFT